MSWTLDQDCQDAQDKQLMQYPLTLRSKWKMHRIHWKFQSQNVQIFGYVYQRTNSQIHVPVRKIWSFLLSEICTLILWQDCYGTGKSGKFFYKKRLSSEWECLFVNREKGFSCLCMWTIIKLSGKKQNIFPMWKILMKDVDLGEPTSFLDHVWLGCAQRERQISKDIIHIYRNMFESRNSAGALEKLPVSEKSDANISSRSFDMEGHAKEVRGKIVRTCK